VIQGSSKASQVCEWMNGPMGTLTINLMPMLCSNMLLVGLTGGLATGKSTVAELFRSCGAMVIDADVLARYVVQPKKPAWREIVREYGKGVLKPDQALDRQALAALIFRNPGKLRKLNAIVHPRVAREQIRLTRELARKDPTAVIIYDAPLLIEAGAHRRMDKVIVVSADQKTQIVRLRHRDDFSRLEAIQRIRAQMPLRKKIKFGDYVIDGTQSLRQLRINVRRIYDELRHQAGMPHNGERWIKA
jgi:dephospho-CoA kinase